MENNQPENPRMHNVKAALDAAEIFARARSKGNIQTFQEELNNAALKNIKDGPVAHKE